MLTVAFELLWLVPLLPIVTAVLLLPVASRVPRGFVVATTVLAWLASAATAAFGMRLQVEKGGWGFAPFGGVRLVAWDLSALPQLSAGPLESGLSAVVALGAGATLLVATSAWGGGARESARPLSGGQLLLALGAYGATQLAVLSLSLGWVIGAAVLASVVGWTVMSSGEPKRAERDAAGRWFVMLRAGDAAWLVALALTLAVFGTLDLRELSVAVPATNPWARAATGALAGFPAGLVISTIAGLLFLGAASRVPALPLPFLFRGATGAPAPALALVHVFAAFVPGVVVVMRTTALWWRATDVTMVASWLFAGTALVSAISALNARDALKIDLHLLHVLAALAIYAALAGQIPGAFLFLTSIALLGPALLSATGAVVEALQGRLDVFEMGGMWRAMRWTDRVRSLATLALVGLPLVGVWFAQERTLFEGLYGPRASAIGSVFGFLTVLVLSLAAYRTLHLVYSGDAPRNDAPAVLVEVPFRRWAPMFVIVVAFIGAGAPWAMPLELLAYIQPNGLEALPSFLWPSLKELFPDPLSLAGNVSRGRGPATPDDLYLIMVVVPLLALAGYVSSVLLYRKGPTALHARIAKLPLIARVGPATAGALGAEKVLAVGAVSLLAQIGRVIVTLVLDIILDGLVTRAIGAAGAVARTTLRIVHNGDVQRAILFAVSAIALALWVWGRP